MKVHAVAATSASGPPTGGNRLVSLCGAYVAGIYVQERTEISRKVLCDACQGALVERANQVSQGSDGRRGPQRAGALEELIASEPNLSATG